MIIVVPFLVAVALVLGWVHSLMAIKVFMWNGWPITRRVFLFAMFPYGMIVYTWFVISHHIGIWLLNFWKDDAPIQIDWDRIAGY